MSDTEKVNKTKLLLNLKTEITDIKQALDAEKGQLEKLQKRLAQVGPALDAMKEGFNGELARLRDEVADESQILSRVVTWIRDKLDSKIDTKIETARELWMGETKTTVSETDAKVRKDVTEMLEDERAKWESKWEDAEQRRKLEVELLKEEFARSIAEAKDQWQQERIQLETQIQTLNKEQNQYLQTRFSSFEAESKLLVAQEVDKAATEKALQTEEKLHGIQSAQSDTLRAEFQKSSDDFRELLKMDLALLRNDERLLWEKERQAIREEERKFRESVRATIVEEISRFQSDALNVINAAQEELAKRKAKGFVEEEATGETPNGNKEDELFAIGKQLSERQVKREKEQQTNKMKIQPDNLLKRFDDDEGAFEASQARRDQEQRQFADLREKELYDRQREEEEQRVREEEIKKERERLENQRKQLENDQKREKQEAAQRQREEDLRKERERAGQLQKLEEERAEKLQQLKQQREEDQRKERERQEEAKKHREDEEKKLEELKRLNREEREEREREFERAQQRREREQAEREQEAALKKEEDKRKKRERKEAEEREREEKEREREERARREKEEEEERKREKKERKFRARQEQEEREQLEREQEEQRRHDEEEREAREQEQRDEEEYTRQEEARKEQERKKKADKEKKEQEKLEKQREREQQDREAAEAKERERQKDKADKERKRKEREDEEARLAEAEEKKRKEKEKEKERERKQREEQQKKNNKDEASSDEEDRQLLTNPSKPKRNVRPPTSVQPQIQTRDTTEEPEATPAKPQKAGSVSVLPPAPGKVNLKSTAQPPPEKQAPQKAELPRESSKKDLTESATGECDVSDPDVQNAWQEVRSDSSSTNWFILGYGGSKTRLSLYGSGSGGIKEFQSNLKNEILYGYIRVPYGDNNQAKFVFVTYFPENISQINRARANPHKMIVDKFVKIYNIQIAATTPDEVGEDVIMPKLRAAGGASYGANQQKPASAASSPKSTDTKKEDDKQKQAAADKQKKEAAEKQKKEDDKKAKEDADRKQKQEDEKRKKEDDRKKEAEEKRKLKEKEDSFTAHMNAGKEPAAGAGAVGAKNKCSVCSKTVYLTEQIIADNKTYHKTCFRCAHCNNIIKLGNFAALNGKLYCKPHFKQLFASKGNYNEGFGKPKLTHEWAAKQAGGDDDEDEEEEEEKPAPVKSAPAPAATKTTPAQPAAPAKAAASSPAPASGDKKKSDITNLYSSVMKDKPAASAKPAAGSKDVLKSTLFDSDEEEDALFAK